MSAHHPSVSSGTTNNALRARIDATPYVAKRRLTVAAATEGP